MSIKEVRLTVGAGLSAQPNEGTTKGEPRLRGYGAVFHALSLDLGGFRERILPGAFSDSLKQREVLALFNHDRGSLLARTRNGSLTISEDEHGLKFEMEPPPTALGRDIVEMVRTGLLSQMSFGFTVLSDGEHWGREYGQTIRTLKRVSLHEISVVPEPAYPSTTVQLRQFIDARISEMLADRRRRLEALVCRGAL